MRVLLYFENEKAMKKSGIGRALSHQKKALEINNIEYTTSVHDQYDVIHINTVFANSYKLLRKANRLNIPVVVHGHSTKEDFLNSFRCSNFIAPWFNHRLMKMYTNANIIVTPTPYSKSLIESYNGVHAKIFPISNGIDLELYHMNHTTNDSELADFKKEFNIGKDQKFICCIGLCFVRKGLLDFVEVARQFPDIKFIWFGEHFKVISSHPIKKAIKHAPKNVIFPGYVDFKYIKVAMAYSSLFFFPSYEENEGIVVLEALASKLPLLIRDIPVFKDWLTDKVNCRKGKSNEEFVEIIKEMLSSDNSNMIIEGYEVVKKRQLDSVGKSLKEVYELAIEEANKKKMAK